jgi:hypothetical protein
MHREQLCEALWPGEPAVVVLNRIRNVLSRARAQAPGLIPGLGPGGVRCARVDVAEFMRKSAAAIRMAADDPQAALTQGAAASDLYGGGLLPGDRTPSGRTSRASTSPPATSRCSGCWPMPPTRPDQSIWRPVPAAGGVRR